MKQPQPSRLIRTAVFCVGFFALYYILNLPQVIFLTGLGFTAWYPATGLTVGALLGLSPWYSLLVLVVDPLVGKLIYHTAFFSWEGLGGSVGPALYYTTAAYVLRGPWKIDASLRRRDDVMRYVTVMIVAAAGSTSVGVVGLAKGHLLPQTEYLKSWTSWFGGEIIGVMGVAPYLLIHVVPVIRRFLGYREDAPYSEGLDGDRRRPPMQISRTLEIALQAIAILGVVSLVLSQISHGQHFMFPLFLPAIWVAMTGGVRRAATGNALMITTVIIGLRIFHLNPDLLSPLSLLLLCVTSTGLIVGASVTEQQHQAREMRQQAVYLNSLVENTPQPIVLLGLNGKMRLCNDAFIHMFQYSRENLAATTVGNLIWPEELKDEGARLFEEAADGRTLHVSTQRRRKNGSLVDVELLSVPLMIDGRSRGVCWIYTDITERLRTAEAEQRHADELDRMVGELQIHSREMGLLSELNNLLQFCSNTKEAFRAAVQSATKLFPTATAGVLYVYRPEQRVLEGVTQWGAEAISESGFEPLSCWGFRRGHAHWSDHPGGGVVCAHLPNPADASYLCVPMMAGNQTAGVLHLQINRGEYERCAPGFISMMEGTERLAETAAGQIALALVNLRLREELENRSIRDPLTGLFNRRMLEASLQREIHRARRKGRRVAVAFIELDHFKKFNDTFGHAAGDEVLVTMGRTFREFYRGDDTVCRYGGEEFAVITPEASASDAAARAEVLRAKAEKLVIHFQGRALDRVTLSIGIAAYPEHGTTPEELLRAADECLYRSKQTGRNRVTVAVSSNEIAAVPEPAAKLLT